MLVLGHGSLNMFTGGCAPVVPGSVGIKPRRTSSPFPIPAPKSGAAGSPHGIPGPVGAEEADPCSSHPGSLAADQRSRCLPGEPELQAGFSCCLLLGAARELSGPSCCCQPAPLPMAPREHSPRQQNHDCIKLFYYSKLQIAQCKHRCCDTPRCSPHPGQQEPGSRIRPISAP